MLLRFMAYSERHVRITKTIVTYLFLCKLLNRIIFGSIVRLTIIIIFAAVVLVAAAAVIDGVNRIFSSSSVRTSVCSSESAVRV